MPFINKTIKSALMKRSRMRNNFLKNRSDNNTRAYNKQHCIKYARIRENTAQ